MKIFVQFHSYLRRLTGRETWQVELPVGALVSDLLERTCREFPPMRDADKILLVAIGVEFAKRSDPLHDGDEVSLMPPLQGG
ncbi:MAG: MoaD/ThiS family protein [Verrucomicrobia bacterium]|nr:MoaD/ThiS family protein [Verrucomicrobiota bacterium]